MQIDIRYSYNESLPYMSSLTGSTIDLLGSFSCTKNVYVLILTSCSVLILLPRTEKENLNTSAPFQTTPLHLLEEHSYVFLHAHSFVYVYAPVSLANM